MNGLLPVNPPVSINNNDDLGGEVAETNIDDGNEDQTDPVVDFGGGGILGVHGLNLTLGWT